MGNAPRRPDAVPVVLRYVDEVKILGYDEMGLAKLPEGRVGVFGSTVEEFLGRQATAGVEYEPVPQPAPVNAPSMTQQNNESVRDKIERARQRTTELPLLGRVAVWAGAVALGSGAVFTGVNTAAHKVMHTGFSPTVYTEDPVSWVTGPVKGFSDIVTTLKGLSE